MKIDKNYGMMFAHYLYWKLVFGVIERPRHVDNLLTHI